MATKKVSKVRCEIKSLGDHHAELTLSMAEAEVLMTDGKARDALFIYQEALQVYGPTTFLLHQISACHLLLARWSDAEPLVQDCLHLVCFKTCLNTRSVCSVRALCHLLRLDDR